MAKRIDTMKIRIGLVIFGAIIILVVAISPILGEKKTQQAEKEIIPAFAPAEYAYPEFFEDQELSNGFTWRINPNNNLVIKNGEKEFIVAPDGSVYVDTGNGLELVSDKDTINSILKAAKEAEENSDPFFDDDISKKITLSDEEIREATGGKITPEDFRYLLDKGLSKEDILALLKEGYTPTQLLEVAGSVNPEDIRTALNRIAELDRRLSESLAGTGITLDQLKEMLKEYGLTAEEYLAGVAKAQQTAVASAAPAAVASQKTKGDVPEMTIDLGGDKSKVDAKEESYQSQFASSTVDPNALATAIASASNTATKTDYESQNNQQGKSDFMNSFQGNSGSYQLTTNDIAAGTIISMTLKTGINTDLPGMVIGEVSQNVYDSLTGRQLLIPKGTRLIASYDSQVSWGQKRALIAWTQLIRPDGFVLQMPGFTGVDKAGYAGYNDKVDNHTWDLIKSAFLASILDLGATEIQTQAQQASKETISTAIGSFTSTLESAGQEYLKKQMNQQPTLTIRPGRTVKLLVNQTITLTPYKY